MQQLVRFTNLQHFNTSDMYYNCVNYETAPILAIVCFTETFTELTTGCVSLVWELLLSSEVYMQSSWSWTSATVCIIVTLCLINKDSCTIFLCNTLKQSPNTFLAQT